MQSSRYRLRDRQGSVYLHVLASSLLVAMIGLGALLAVRIQMRSARLARDCAQARVCAMSAVEMGLLYIGQDPNWRDAWSNGVWRQNVPLGSGRFTVEGIDPTDGILDDSDREPLVLTGTGTQGLARHKTRVTLVPLVKPLAVLNTCLHGTGQVHINSTRQISVVGAPLSTNGSLSNNGTLDGNAEVSVANPLGTITGTLTVSAPAKPMPPASLIAGYADRATEIPYTGTIDKAVLAPGCNPWGAANPDGLYVLDTGGNALTIRNARIHGTLVILAPGKTVTLEGAMHCRNYRSQFPVLLVEGNLVIKCPSADTPLSELADARNYNPFGAPFEGVCDEDTEDTYPNEIRGLIHVKGSLMLQETARIVGVVLCEGSITCDGANPIVHDPGLYACPPDGYTFVDGMRIAPNSWRQVVD